MDSEEKSEFTVSEYDNRWRLLTLLAESQNGHRLNFNEKEQLNDLLQFADNMKYLQNQRPTTIFSDDSDKEYNIQWFPLLKVIFLICISSFTFGYITIQTASIITNTNGHNGILYHKFPHMPQFERSVLTSSSLIGAVVGSFLVFAYSSCTTITYSFSRRRILILSNFPVIIGGLIAITAQWTSSWLVLIGFTFQGIGFGISSIVAPILIAEISPTPIRAFLTWFSQLFITFGMLISSVISWAVMDVKYGWIILVILGIIPAVLQFILRKHITQSPRLLIAKFHKRQDRYANLTDDTIICSQAMDIIQTFYLNIKDAKKEYDSITKHLTNNENTCLNSRGVLLRMISRLSDDSVSSANFTRSIFVGMFMNAFQQLTGCNVIFYNSQTIVHNMYTHNDFTFVGVTILYGANFIATVICLFCVYYNFIKHRTLLFVGTAMMLTSVLLLGIININIDDATTHCENADDLINKLALSKLPFYIFGFAISLSGFTWLINTELFPLCNRIKFGSFCVFIQWFFNALITLTINNGWIQDGSTMTTPLYFICGGAILVCIGFISKFIPETKGISLEFAVRAHNPGIIWIS